MRGIDYTALDWIRRWPRALYLAVMTMGGPAFIELDEVNHVYVTSRNAELNVTQFTGHAALQQAFIRDEFVEFILRIDNALRLNRHIFI